MKEKLIAFALNNINIIFKLFRIFLPIIKLGGTAYVFRFRDVEEVLSRSNIFGVTYAERMGTVTGGGSFFLGMNDTATYERDLSNMRILIPRSDVHPVIKPLVQNYAQELVDALGENFDFVKDLSGRVPAHFCRAYLGVPGKDESRFIDWNTYLFEYLFYFGLMSDEAKQQALTYAADFRAYLDELIAEAKTREPGDDFLGRALKLQQSETPGMTDLDIRNNIIGITVGTVATTSMTAVAVLEYLLDNTEQLELAQQLARADQDDQLTKLVMETLRFKTVSSLNVGVLREALSDYRIARGTLRSTKIRRGESVMALTQSAMMDGWVLDKPGEFSLERPFEHYMTFGYGMHRCFGFYINLVQLPAILKPILKKRHLARAAGEDGRTQHRGPFPTQLNIVVKD